MEDTSQQVNTGIAVSMKWITGNLYGGYFTAGEHCYCSSNEVHYSEYYMEYTSQQVDINITV
jgi:hypothetical protein